jgi:GGDEF domain-containing protein
MSAPPSWREPRHPDHYYWLTARLAARGAHRATGRAVASAIVGLGAIPVMLMFSSDGSAEWLTRLLEAAIAVSCVVVGGLWLRQNWPTRTQSALCVVVGGGCIAAACLISPRPLIGLLGATSFAVLAGFTAIFHGRRLLVGVWAVAAFVLLVLAMRLTAWDTTAAVSCSILVAVVIFFTTFVSRALLGLIDVDDVTGMIEPVTGLLNRDGFVSAIATIMGARSRQDDRYLVIVAISLDSFSIARATSPVSKRNRVRVAISQCLRETLRRDAVVAHLGDHEFFVADVFGSRDPTPLTDRICAALRLSSREFTASIGSASTALAPLAVHSPHDVTDQLLDHAVTAVKDARLRGGNQCRSIHLPELTTPRAASTD